MNLERKNCVICNNTELRIIYKFELFPVYMGVSEHDRIDEDIYEDMTWVICKNCGCIQLKTLIDLDILYHKGHNGAVGKTWEEHHKKLADIISEYGGSSVLEIGGGNLKLANFVTDKRSDLMFTVVDPNCDKSDRQNIITKTELFDYDNYNIEYEIDTIVHSHVLEHFYEPMENTKIFSHILETGQRMIMAIPMLDVFMEDNFTNSINFEHNYMLGEDLLDFMISKNGFKVIHKEIFKQYNLFVVCEKIDEVIEVSLENSYERNLNLFNNFISFHEEFVNKVNELGCDGFYVFGGHIFSQFLFMFGLDVSKCICVLDNDPNKIGRRLYGTNMLVQSPKILSDVEKPIVVLRAAQFSDEIEEDILTNINSKTVIIK